MLRKLAILAAAAWVLPAAAADFPIGYLEQRGDTRYGATRTFAQFLLEPLGRPYAGAEVALREVTFHGAAADATFVLERERAKDAAALVESVKTMHARGIRFIALDAPGETVEAAAEATRGLDLMLFNISARDDRLRSEACALHLLHVVPSQAMLTDALAQFLAFRKWRRVLVLQGASPADQAFGGAFVRSARKFGLHLVDTRPFVLSNDPRERGKNNVLLLTAEGDYDVVFVADADGEFARDVPYQTAPPRPVVGAAGLGAVAWHWAWERHGAPQLEKRFEEEAGRPMRSYDWAAWAAVKAIAEAVQRTASTDFAKLRDWLRGDEFTLDAFKGNPASFRRWDNQLRQPVLLATQNWVVERAPLPGFEHRTNNLDTLGIDGPETRCRY